MLTTGILRRDKCVMIFVDEFSRQKVVRFPQKKIDATAALRNTITTYLYVTLEGLKIGSIRS